MKHKWRRVIFSSVVGVLFSIENTGENCLVNQTLSELKNDLFLMVFPYILYTILYPFSNS